MKIIRIEDKEYPEKLRNIYDPPKTLYVMGDYSILNNFGIGIVGTRKASKYGIEITKSLAYGLARKEINVISGLAKGIDTAAHQGTLLAKGKTIAVIAGGFDHIYPKENIPLMWNIINSGGAVITEYQKDTKPEAKNFPKRNRIISGLSERNNSHRSASKKRKPNHSRLSTRTRKRNIRSSSEMYYPKPQKAQIC